MGGVAPLREEFVGEKAGRCDHRHRSGAVTRCLQQQRVAGGGGFVASGDRRGLPHRGVPRAGGVHFTGSLHRGHRAVGGDDRGERIECHRGIWHDRGDVVLARREPEHGALPREYRCDLVVIQVGVGRDHQRPIRTERGGGPRQGRRLGHVDALIAEDLRERPRAGRLGIVDT